MPMKQSRVGDINATLRVLFSHALVAKRYTAVDIPRVLAGWFKVDLQGRPTGAATPTLTTHLCHAQ